MPCLRSQNSGISSIGPGRYSATSAIKSSNRSGLARLSRSRMPRDSNWNTAVVLARRKTSKVAAVRTSNPMPIAALNSAISRPTFPSPMSSILELASSTPQYRSQCRSRFHAFNRGTSFVK